jgi:hypothetical protein
MRTRWNLLVLQNMSTGHPWQKSLLTMLFFAKRHWGPSWMPTTQYLSGYRISGHFPGCNVYSYWPDASYLIFSVYFRLEWVKKKEILWSMGLGILRRQFAAGLKHESNEHQDEGNDEDSRPQQLFDWLPIRSDDPPSISCPIRDQDGIQRWQFAFHLTRKEIEPIIKEKSEELRAEQLF